MISQYANSPVLVKLNKGLETLFDDSIFVQNWYDVVFNLSSATGYGLDVWGAILNRDRKFVYDGNEYYLQGAQTIDGVEFTDEEMDNLYRKVLQLTAMRYIGNASIASINTMIQYVFDGKCYCYEYAPMQIRYVFRFYMSKVEKAIIETLNPHPAGVLTSFEYLPIGRYFGFYVKNTAGNYKGTWNATGQTDYSSIPLPVSAGDKFKVQGSATIGGIDWCEAYVLVIKNDVAVDGTISNSDVEASTNQPYLPFDNGPFYK